MVKHKEPLGGLEIAARKSAAAEQYLFGEEDKMTTANTQATKVAVDKGIKLTAGTEAAFVRVNEGNIVEVERNESVTLFQPHLTLDAVLKQFVDTGWTVAEEYVVVKSALTQEIPVFVQEDVDEYLALHEEMANLKAKLDKKKAVVRPYMEQYNKDAIRGSFGKQVYLQDVKASNSTSLFSDFELNDLRAELDGAALRKVSEMRVNSEKLDGLLKSGSLSKEKVEAIRKLKIAKVGTPHFKVKR